MRCKSEKEFQVIKIILCEKQIVFITEKYCQNLIKYVSYMTINIIAASMDFCGILKICILFRPF